MYQPQGQINYRGGGPRINHTTGKKWLFYPYTNYSTIISTKKLPLCSIPSLPSKFTKCLVYRLQFSNKPERQGPSPFHVWTIFHSCHPSQEKNGSKCGKRWNSWWILFSCIIEHQSFYSVFPTAALNIVLVDLSSSLPCKLDDANTSGMYHVLQWCLYIICLCYDHLFIPVT